MSQALQSTNTKFKNGGTMMVVKRGVALKSMSTRHRFHARAILAITAFGTIGGAILAYESDNPRFLLPFTLLWVAYIVMHQRWTNIVLLTHEKILTRNSGKTFETRTFDHDKDAIYMTADGERTMLMEGLSPDEQMKVMEALGRLTVQEDVPADDVVW